MSLQSINNFCGAHNLAGLVTIEYAPTHWIYAEEFQRILSSTGNWQYTISFTEGSWLSASLLPSQRLWNESAQNGEQGTAYQQTVRGIAPKLRPDVSVQLAQMEKMGFILKVKDKNGQPWILGDLDHPFFFLAAGSTGDEAGLNNYELVFTSNTRHRAAGYVPALP